MKGADTKTEARRRGDLGEHVAARYLKRRFYRILERNWFFYRKEIDLIAQRGKTLVICEVKTRTRTPGGSSPFGPPSAAVDTVKQKNLLLAGAAYAKSIGWHGNLRMDVIEVYLSEESTGKRPKVKKVNHIQNAFTA